MKGVFFKYDADPHDPLMRDHQAACGADICGMMDPDFWTKQVPVWAICGPYVRQQLKPGDMVFYLPKLKSIRETGLDDYICTGILVVQTVVKNKDQVLTDPQLTKDYKKEYLKDLANHLKHDGLKNTAKIRGTNFIKGDPTKSFWLGKNTQYLKPTLQNMRSNLSEKLSYQRIPYLNATQARAHQTEIQFPSCLLSKH